ncbi:SDR family NAD(P)-dependent oxidoreductase [Leifsonia shinshuensis]|uniref:NAD(P)-dependent dehydrogenase (Short-subunit alcohol dehydrogenase family) n=1 Tax=Leifsonia shinshuensis TaxID=150026 RepID=A0A853D347_9MICO|nr:SDR family NAD(P)-dependent oxidoreductase [Leifsonia shinshuensis]NYJ25814.1 NAD(P)-dependent dehydrogenase (short-subunit alcohol dehydrogenase family) [Leifsonia shinshuensis]
MSLQETSVSEASAAAADWLGLTGARVVIAGAGGIGVTCAQRFLDAGARLLIVDRDERRLRQLEADPAIGGRGGRTLAVDLTEKGAAARVIGQAVETLGGLDVVLHCVGINDRRPLLEFSDDEWKRIIDVNLTTLFALGQAAGRRMTEQGHGRIIALSSVSGLLAHENHGPYAASKGGINQLIRVMAREWAKDGVTVNAVAPGYVETPLTSEHLSEGGNRERLESQVPAGRLGTPDEIAGPVLFLASRQAGFITGHVLYIDGGRTLV